MHMVVLIYLIWGDFLLRSIFFKIIFYFPALINVYITLNIFPHKPLFEGSILNTTKILNKLLSEPNEKDVGVYLKLTKVLYCVTNRKKTEPRKTKTSVL